MSSRRAACCRRRASPLTPMSPSSATGACSRPSPRRSPRCSRPMIICERVAGMLARYDFVIARTLAYFDKRLPAGAARCRFRPRLRQARTRRRRPAAGRARGAELQMRRALVAARRARPCLCDPGHAPPGAWGPGAERGLVTRPRPRRGAAAAARGETALRRGARQPRAAGARARLRPDERGRGRDPGAVRRGSHASATSSMTSPRLCRAARRIAARCGGHARGPRGQAGV